MRKIVFTLLSFLGVLSAHANSDQKVVFIMDQTQSEPRVLAITSDEQLGLTLYTCLKSTLQNNLRVALNDPSEFLKTCKTELTLASEIEIKEFMNNLYPAQEKNSLLPSGKPQLATTLSMPIIGVGGMIVNNFLNKRELKALAAQNLQGAEHYADLSRKIVRQSRFLKWGTWGVVAVSLAVIPYFTFHEDSNEEVLNSEISPTAFVTTLQELQTATGGGSEIKNINLSRLYRELHRVGYTNWGKI